MSWNYRIVKDKHGYSIKEVYYDAKGVPAILEFRGKVCKAAFLLHPGMVWSIHGEASSGG